MLAYHPRSDIVLHHNLCKWLTLRHHSTLYPSDNTCSSDTYGLEAYEITAKIHIVSPLTKESISKNNGGGGNWGGKGTIEQVDEQGNILEI